MIDIRSSLQVAWGRISLAGARRHQTYSTNFKLKALGCAAIFIAGCSSAAPHGDTSMGAATQKMAVAPSTEWRLQIPENPPKWELTIPEQPSIDRWVRYFSEEKHKSFQIQLDRARRYTVPVQDIFERKGLPKDLIYVALIESGFCPTARSHANAVGMWQFISSTGKRYGLEQDQWIDERRHPFKAAEAAAEYLSFLYDWFGSWPLALAAYNGGENAVQGALVQSGLKTFWDLAQNGYLPSETRDYVPKILAAIKIIRNRDHYGFFYDPQQYVPRHETVSIPGGVKLSWIGKHIGVPENLLQDCNPELSRSVTPPWCLNYDLRVPIGKADAVLKALTECPVEEEKPEKLEKPEPKIAAPLSHPVASAYQVRRGDTWFSLARKYNCTPQSLASLNGCRISQPLRAGQTLKTPGKPGSMIASYDHQGTELKAKVSMEKNKKSPVAPAQKPRRPQYYSACRGDTLWSIAERFGVTVQELRAHNKLSPNQKIVPGDMLIIDNKKPDTARMAKRRT